MGAHLRSTFSANPNTCLKAWLLLLYCSSDFFLTTPIIFLRSRVVAGFSLAPQNNNGMIRARSHRLSLSFAKRTSRGGQGEGAQLQNNRIFVSNIHPSPYSSRARTASELNLYFRANDVLPRKDKVRLFASIANATRSDSELDNVQSLQDEALVTDLIGEYDNIVSEQDQSTTKPKARTKSAKDDISPLLEGLKSRPVPNGNWKPGKSSCEWAKDFGRRCPEYDKEVKERARLLPGDEGYHDVSAMKVPKATIVRTKEQARKVMEVLMNADPSILHACDTEVMDINLKEVGPIGNGYVTCASVYSGPDFDYGLGDGPGTALWIDNLDDAFGVLEEFKDWFEDPTKLKVWHNYGFDRHVMWNEGINCLGFGGDTMHMARLQDTSRAKFSSSAGQGYSLEALTADLLNMRKRPMKEIFGVKRLRKDGTEGSLVDVPPIEVLQRDPQFRANFIMYSCYDAEGTWRLHEVLKAKLQKKGWMGDKNLYDYYWDNMREFGHVLTDMERRGIRVDAKDYLAGVEIQARKDREKHSENFRRWAASQIGPDGLALNPASSLQLNTFLFGGALNAKTKEETERERVFKVAREEVPEIALEAYEKRDEEAKSKGKTSKCIGVSPSIELNESRGVPWQYLSF